MSPPGPGPARAVEVLPDVTGIDRTFDYRVPEMMDLRVGDIVRVPLAGRRVRGWVAGEAAGAFDPAELKPVEAVVSAGLDQERVALARFASWRYAGRLRPLFVAGSPERDIPPGPPPRPAPAPSPPAPAPDDPVAALADSLFSAGGAHLLQLPPCASRLSVVTASLVAAARRAPGSDLLVLVPERRDVETLAGRLGRLGVPCASLPEQFAAARRGGAAVIGTRNGVLGPVGRLGGVLVLDAHAEAFTSERSPAWNAAVLAIERARRAGVPCLLTSPAAPPSLPLPTPDPLARGFERRHWPALEILDRRSDDPRSGLYAPGLATTIRAALAADPLPVVCVLNRRGRLRLLSCRACGELVRCLVCGGAMGEWERPAPGTPALLECRSCRARRPAVCAECHGTVLRALRIGAPRAAEELAALVGVPTRLVAGGGSSSGGGPERVLVGTEAVLHRARRASLVVFLDFDQHLLAPRLEASAEALLLIGLAGRLVGGRGEHAAGVFARRVVVQTRLASHEVLEAARAGDPGSLRRVELDRRRAANLPPFSVLALLEGAGAPALAAALAERFGLEAGGLDAPAARPGAPARALVRSPSIEALAQGLFALRDEIFDVRVEVDPRDV